MDKLPDIVLTGLQPLPVDLVDIAIGPVTIGQALLLDRLDTGALQGLPLDGAQLFAVLYILSQPAIETEAMLAGGRARVDGAIAEFSKRIRALDEETLERVVTGLIARALEACGEVKFKVDDEAVFALDGNGCGWLTNIASALLEITSWPLRAVLDTPLQTAFILITTYKVRSGAEWTGTSWIASARHEREDAEAPAAEPAPSAAPVAAPLAASEGASEIPSSQTRIVPHA